MQNNEIIINREPLVITQTLSSKWVFLLGLPFAVPLMEACGAVTFLICCTTRLIFTLRFLDWHIFSAKRTLILSHNSSAKIIILTDKENRWLQMWRDILVAKEKDKRQIAAHVETYLLMLLMIKQDKSG